MKKVILFLILILSVSVVSFASQDNKASIETKGVAYLIANPDIAHFVLKVSGNGENYEASTKSALSKIEEMETIFSDIMGQKIDVIEIKRDYKPKNLFSEEDYVEAQKQYIMGMAKAMKGEDVSDAFGAEEKGMITNILVYFSTNKFTEENILKFKSSLAEKEIAFNKANLFNMSWIFNIDQSSILFGIQDPMKHLEKLSKDGYENAFQKASVITSSLKKKIKGIRKISGCGTCLEGPVETSEIGKRLGIELGPLTLDPKRLVIKYEKKYEFDIE